MDDDLTLKVFTCTRKGNGYTLSDPRILAGWEEVRFSRGIERCPSDFQVSMTERYPNAVTPEIQVQPGDYCEVYLGSDRVSSGWIDRYIPSFSDRMHTVTITGRSRCEDIVDCAAVYQGYQISNATALSIAQQLCKPFGISATLAAGTDVGAVVPQIVILAGETAYDVIERVCRYRALLVYDTPSGDLLLSGVGTDRAASGFQEGVNVERASVIYAADQRYSDYYAIYQGIDLFGDAGGAANQIAHVVDSGVQRYRPRVVISENMIGGVTIAEWRAHWEAARRAGRSFAVHFVTDSWRDAAGVLYAPNTLAPVALPTLKLGSAAQPVQWLIAQTVYRKGRDGTTCEITMMPPQAFYQEPFTWMQMAPDQKPG